MAIGDRIKQLIDIKGVTAYIVSAKTGISQATLSRLMSNATKKPNINNIELLANYFNVNPDWLLTGNGERYLPPKNDFTQLTEQEISDMIAEKFSERVMDMYKRGELYPAEVHDKIVAEKDAKISELQRDVWELQKQIEELKK